MSFRPIAFIALLVAGCASTTQVKQLEERLASLEKKVEEQAKAKMAELNEKHGSTQVAAKAKKTAAELEVVGKAVTELKIEKWYQGETKLDMNSNTPTLLVFWESWCPHCRREVPKMEETYTKYKGKMNLVGLTKVTRSSTDEKVVEFIKENKVSYPMAKEAGDVSETFAVSGIPAAAVVKNGKIVWRGHPARLTEEMINGWL